MAGFECAHRRLLRKTRELVREALGSEATLDEFRPQPYETGLLLTAAEQLDEVLAGLGPTNAPARKDTSDEADIFDPRRLSAYELLMAKGLYERAGGTFEVPATTDERCRCETHGTEEREACINIDLAVNLPMRPYEVAKLATASRKLHDKASTPATADATLVNKLDVDVLTLEEVRFLEAVISKGYGVSQAPPGPLQTCSVCGRGATDESRYAVCPICGPRVTTKARRRRIRTPRKNAPGT